MMVRTFDDDFSLTGGVADRIASDAHVVSSIFDFDLVEDQPIFTHFDTAVVILSN